MPRSAPMVGVAAAGTPLPRAGRAQNGSATPRSGAAGGGAPRAPFEWGLPGQELGAQQHCLWWRRPVDASGEGVGDPPNGNC